MSMRRENFANCCHAAKLSTLLHEVAAMKNKVVLDLWSEVEILPFLRMHNERNDQTKM